MCYIYVCVEFITRGRKAPESLKVPPLFFVIIIIFCVFCALNFLHSYMYLLSA